MILWGTDHQARAEALALICGESAAAVANLPRSSNGIEPLKSTDVTLTVWGHGNETHFSEMLDVEFGTLIQSWKKQNPSLKTVELVTCNAQHNAQPLAGYASRVAKFVERVYQDITIKALPKGEHSDDFSILWANAGTKTYCYITAPSQVTLNHANQRLQALEPTYSYDLSLVAAAMGKERTLSSPNNFTVVGAGLQLLRASLTVIRTS